MVKKSIRNIIDALQMMWHLDKAVFLASCVISLIDAVLPFVGIVLSAHVLDALPGYNGRMGLILTAVLTVGGIFLLTVLKSFLQKIHEVHGDICVRKFDMKCANGRLPWTTNCSIARRCRRSERESATTTIGGQDSTP